MYIPAKSDTSMAFYMMTCRVDGKQCGSTSASWWAWADGFFCHFFSPCVAAEFLIWDEKCITPEDKPENEGFWFPPSLRGRVLIAQLLIGFQSSEESTQTVGYSITSAVIMTWLFNIWTIRWQLWFPFPSPFLQQALVEKSHAGLLLFPLPF